MSKVSQRIDQQRKIIRRAQVSTLFEAKRDLMTVLSKQQAISTFMPHLERIKQFVIYQQNVKQMQESLQKIRHIMRDYLVIDLLVKKIEFMSPHVAEMKLGSSYAQMTWVDLILVLFKNFGEQLKIDQDCSCILMNSASQLQEKTKNKICLQNESVHLRQFKKLLENYPYDLIIQCSSQTALYSLCFVYEMIIGCNDSTAIYFMLCRKTPNILALLNSLFQNRHLMKIYSLQEEFIRTSLTVSYYAQRYSYVIFALEEFKILSARMKEILLDILAHPKSQEQFLKTCNYFKILCGIQYSKIEQKEFQFIESMLARQLAQDHSTYILLLKTIMYRFKFTFTPQSSKLIMMELFDVTHTSNYDMILKGHLIDILLSQVVNCGNRFTEEDAQIFISCWGEYSQVDRLLKLAEILNDFNLGEKTLKGLFNLLSILMNGQNLQHLNMMINLLQQELNSLLYYDEFRRILSENQFKVI